jgi:hypothetical protein
MEKYAARDIIVTHFVDHLGETFDEALPEILSFALTEREAREAFDFCVANDLLMLSGNAVIGARTTMSDGAELSVSLSVGGMRHYFAGPVPGWATRPPKMKDEG